jgi:MFS family permease
MFFISRKKEIVVRNYDVAGEGFSQLSSNQNHNKQKFTWSVSLLKDLLAIYSAIFLAAIGYGILMALISFKLEQFVKNEILISIAQASQIIAGIFFAKFLPNLGKKFGLIKSIYIGSFLQVLCSLMMYNYFGYFFWLFIVFTYGIGAFICGVTRQTIMIDIAPVHIRGMIISLGSMLVAFGNSFGPILISTTRLSEHYLGFVLASLFFITSLIPLSRLKIKGKLPEVKKIGILRYITNSPKIMFAGFSVSYSTSSINAFIVIYAIKIGIEKEQASLLLSVILFGSVFAIPIGYLVDIFNRRILMMLFAFLSIISLNLILLNHDIQRMYILLFINFGLMMGMKLSALVLINEKYKETQRLAVNSVFSRVSLSGNICGIFSTGILMKCLGVEGLWISSIGILSIFLFFCLINYTNKFKNSYLKLSN